MSLSVLVGAFFAGMAGVVYLSLSGAEVKVPDLVGKDFVESEKELASLGLKIKRRADRPSPDKINTVLEQLPKPGETVKTGQMILVVVSKFGGGDEAPPSLKKDIEEDDAEKIEEMISDKPKKTRTNSNTNRKKADTTRDVIGNTATSNSNDSKSADTSDPPKKEPAGDDKKNDKPDPPKPQNSPVGAKPSSQRPAAREPNRP